MIFIFFYLFIDSKLSMVNIYSRCNEMKKHAIHIIYVYYKYVYYKYPNVNIPKFYQGLSLNGRTLVDVNST